MSYVIYNNTGTILTVIPSGKVDQVSTSLTLVGKDIQNYGSYYNQNLITLITNSANSTVNPPNAPIQGQLWYDTTYKKLRVFDGTFKSVAAATLAGSEPGWLSPGDFWYNTSTGVLNFYNGISYSTINIAPMSNNSGWVQPVSAIRDNTPYVPQPQTVTLLEQDGQVVGALSNVGFTASNYNSTNTFGRANSSSVFIAKGLTIFGDLFVTGSNNISTPFNTGTLVTSALHASSATVACSVSNALTIGTGLSGTSYNGSSAVTIANTGVLTITGSADQVLVNSGTSSQNGNITLTLSTSTMLVANAVRANSAQSSDTTPLTNTYVGVGNGSNQLSGSNKFTYTDPGVNLVSTLGGAFYTGHQSGSGYAYNAAGIFQAITDNPNGTSNYYFQGSTAGSTNLSIRADGQLIINNGTTAISGAMLTVNGGADVTGVVTASDFVSTVYGDVKTYIDVHDYTNSSPLAGVLNENYVPLYGAFGFSLGANATYTFFLTDDQGFEVVFFHANTPTGVVTPYRAYRFNPTSDFVYDTAPVAVSFSNSGEYVNAIYNIGTQFAFISLYTPGSNSYRRVLVKTNGSSKSLVWTYYADVTTLTNSGSCNVFLKVDPNTGDRILVVTMSSSSVVLNVYNSSQTLLRTQELFNSSTDVTNIDHSGAGNTVGNSSLPFGYNPFGTAFAFTWNKFTENFIMKLSGYYTAQNSSGGTFGIGFGATILWNIPSTWLASGSGTPTNLIPLNPSGYRYNKLPDSTWDSATGGMGTGYSASGQGGAITTDEYGQSVTMGVVGTWDTTGGDIYRFPLTLAVAVGGNLTATYHQRVAIPDASPWSKDLYAYWGNIIDNNIVFNGNSNQYGNQAIAANFSTSTFSSIDHSNDTLQLDPLTYRFEGSNVPGGPNSLSSTSVSGSPINYLATPGSELIMVTVVGGHRVYTHTGYTIPALPTAIGGVHGISLAGNTVYNGNNSDKKFWSVVADSTSSCYIAKFSSGSWSNIYGPFIASQIQGGQSNRGDTSNEWAFGRGDALLTSNGKFFSGFAIPLVGGEAFYILQFDTTNNTATVLDYGNFGPEVASAYGGISGYYGISFGFSSIFGYYAIMGIGSQTSIFISSSKDPRAVGSPITEDQWINNTATRYDTYIGAQATVGLTAYVRSYPIYLGGYYNTVPNTTLQLVANATNYVYVKLLSDNRYDIEVYTSTEYIPSSFSQVLIGEVVTGSQNITSSQSYIIAQNASLTANNVFKGSNQFQDVTTQNLSVNGVVAISSSTGSPSNHVTPASWLRVTVGGSTYYMPLYQ